MTVAKIYIVRHGETVENRANIIQGQLDTLLNEYGKQQAQIVATALRSTPFDYAFTSDLKRAAETAEIILQYHPRVALEKTKLLRERGLGAKQGTRRTGHNVVTSELDSTAEPRADFVARSDQWWEGVLAQVKQSERPTPHHILAKLESTVPFAYKCGNVSITIVDVDDDGLTKLVQYSGTDHLKGTSVLDGNADIIDEPKE